MNFHLPSLPLSLPPGYHPFDPLNDADDDLIGERIVKEKEKYVSFDQPVWERISPAAKELVRRLLTTAEESRPTAQVRTCPPSLPPSLPAFIVPTQLAHPP
jgi:hypothetical protein